MKRFSTISRIHYFRLLYRSLLFLTFLIQYVNYRMLYGKDFTTAHEKKPVILLVMCTVYVLEMILRFLPNSFESPGAQKQFARNYKKTGKTEIQIQDNHAAVLVAMIWIGCNAFFGFLYWKGLLDDGMMIILCGAYSICDLICILFFCPFQSWFLKSRCCADCRIYNWDYPMMFTPLLFVRKDYAFILTALSIALLIRWEITFYMHPERFSENTNEYLHCNNCHEKLCAHKKQLKTLWRQIDTSNKKKAEFLKIK